MSDYAVMPLSDYSDICNAVRAKTGGTELLKAGEVAAAIAGIEGGGGENILDYVGSLSSTFTNVVFGAESEVAVRFGGKYAGTSTMSLYGAFRNARAKSVKVSCERTYTGGFSLAQAFRRDSADALSLERIDFSDWTDGLRPSDMTRIVYSQILLKEILGEFDMTYCTTIDTAAFAGASALKTIRFKPGTIALSINFSNSPGLSDESIQSIIDGLANVSDGDAKTLTLHATAGAKLTDDQKSAASAKNWTLTY